MLGSVGPACDHCLVAMCMTVEVNLTSSRKHLRFRVRALTIYRFDL